GYPMNRRQMMKAFPALAAAATAVADAIQAEAQAVTPQMPKAPPAYKGRLRPGVIALSYRPQLEAKEMTYEEIVHVVADLGLEGHDDLTKTSAQLLTIVKRVNHPAARIALDCGNFRKDGYKECEMCAPYASSTHVKTQMSTPDGQREPADWAKLFGILANAGYRGYVSLELSTPDNPVPKYAAELIRCARMYSGA